MAEVSQTKKEIPMEKSEKSKKRDMSLLDSMNEDLLHKILSRLPEKSFAFASCVNRSWNSVCNGILSRPKIISAFSRSPDIIRAGEEAIDKVLSEPIRPDFVIANITFGDMEETLRMITKRVGSRVPIIVSIVDGVLGKEACNGNITLTGLLRKETEAGRIQFHTAISRGISPIDLRYKAVNVNVSHHPNWPATYLTAKRIGEAEVLNGDQILDDIGETLLGNPLEFGEGGLYIGVIKRRKYSVGSEKSKIMSSLVFHEVDGYDEQYLFVDGVGIKTGDFFQVYGRDRKKAEASLNAVSSQLRNLTVCSREKKTEVVGGFVFVSKGRGDSFFGCPNANISPFLENFPELPFGGIFCCGQIGRSLSMEEEEEERSIRKCLHVCSSVYLIVSLTS